MTASRSKSPWRTPKVGRPESIALPPKPKPAAAEEPWWTKYATDASREAFYAAAADRDREMRGRSHAWRQQSVNFS